MGFPFHAIKIPIPTSISSAFSIINLWSNLKWMILAALSYAGFYKPTLEEEVSDHTFNDYIYILDGPCPSLVPIHVNIVTAAIKNVVPILLYVDLIGDGEDNEVATGGGRCTICMEAIEHKQEVRDLRRCNHVFHRGCLDTWIDSGHVTCPLCRSMLLPPKVNPYIAARNPPIEHGNVVIN